MKPYENTILISDLDGTLIPRGGRVSQANRAAIERFVRGGGRFGVATGRTPEAAAGYVGGLAITAPSIFFNGAMLYDWQAKSVLATRTLPGGDVWPRFAAQCLAHFPQACIEVYTADNCNIISDPANDDPRLPHEFYRYQHVQLVDVADTERTPWLKFFVSDEPARLAVLEEETKAFGIGALAHSFYSEANYYEYVAQGVSKGAMLEEIRRLPSCAGVRIVALGDYLNDNEMLAAADVGVASGNAHEGTKAAADVVGCRVEDDLVPWVLEHVLRDGL